MNLDDQGIITEKREGNVGAAANDAKFLISSYHQLIFHIMYELGQFHHRQNKGEERRGVIWQKSNNCLANIEQQLMTKIAKNIGEGSF